MKKKIWIMNHYAGSMFFDKGGRHYNFAKYLRKAEYEPVIFCANSKHGQQKLFFDKNELCHEHIAEEIDTPFVFVKSRAYLGNGKQRVLNMIDFYRNVKKAAKQYAKAHGAPDIIYASSVHPLTLVAGIQLAKSFGVKCICEIRDLWPESIVAYGIAGPHNPAVIALRRLEKWIYERADAVVFTMEGAYDYIIDQGWEKEIPRSKVHYINNGVDLEAVQYNREHFQVDDPDLQDLGMFKVVYTGSVRKVNNLGTLLDAAKLVTNPKVRFLIWGGGDEKSMLEQRVRDEKINNVIFKGKVEKKYIPYIVSRADLNFAHNTPSPLFRFGISFNKIFDYFAAGKPILTDFPCPYNPVIQANAGCTVENATAGEVAQEIEKMASLEEKEYVNFCSNALNTAEVYDFKNLTKNLIEIISK